MTGRERLGTAFVYLTLAVAILLALFPFWWMIDTSLKRPVDIFSGVALWPQQITFGNYYRLFNEFHFGSFLLNSIVIVTASVGISLVIGTLAAYALARLKFVGVGGLGTAIFVTYLVPTSLLFLPLAQVVNWLGLGDSKWALVVTYPTFLVPFCTWLLMGYFRTVPKEVEECAMVDGATRIQALWRIVLPIAVPGLVCAALFAFTLSWNEFIYALTFTSSSEQITASVGVTTELIRGDIYYWGSLMAGAVLASVPIVVLYVFFLDYYVSGLTAGAIK
jgi:multiple sugar transport system permease protein